VKIAHVRLKNVLGIDELEFDAGRFVTISGPNGSGKTSILEAIKAVVAGGNDATLLRHGEEAGEIVLVLDDQTTIRRRLGKTQSVTVEKDGVRYAKPQETINTLRDMVSVNPVAFLEETDPKKRVDMLLAALPAKADPERIRSLVGQADFAIDGESAIEQITAAYKTIFSERRATNVAIREKEGSINQLAQTLPAEAEAAAGQSEADLEAQLKEIDDAQEAEMQRIDDKLGTLKATHDTEVEAMRQQIAELQAKIAEKAASFAETQRRADGQRSISSGRWRESRQPFVDALNLARTNRDALMRAETTKANMRTLRVEADRLQGDSERMTKTLEGLQAYKAELLAAIPIPGLQIEDGQLLREGLPFERLNEAQRVEIAFEVAAMRAGRLRIVCVDGIERMDDAHLAAFKARAQEVELQCFVTMVSPDGEALTINAA
jgi:energy-coupling factor transporter ATP-binding protein EcfA2